MCCVYCTLSTVCAVHVFFNICMCCVYCTVSTVFAVCAVHVCMSCVHCTVSTVCAVYVFFMQYVHVLCILYCEYCVCCVLYMCTCVVPVYCTVSTVCAVCAAISACPITTVCVRVNSPALIHNHFIHQVLYSNTDFVQGLTKKTAH